MNELYQRVLNYWRGLGARERAVLAAGGIVATVLLAYGLVWAPLQRNLNELRASVPKEYEQLQWMRAQAARVKILRSSAPAMQSNGILSFVEQSAQSYNIRPYIKRNELVGTNSARLAIDEVPFNSLVEWLANLQKQGGVRIENADFESLPAPGLVNARLLLRAAGS